jgi:hypothetical protein
LDDSVGRTMGHSTRLAGVPSPGAVCWTNQLLRRGRPKRSRYVAVLAQFQRHAAVMSETTRRRSRGCSPLRMTGTILSLVRLRANCCMITLLSGHKRVGTSLLSRDTVAASTRARCVPRRARAGTKPSVNSLRIDQFEELGVVAIVHMNPNEHRPWGVERLLQCRDDVLRRTN